MDKHVDFATLLGDLPQQARLPLLRTFVQHGRVSTLEHSIGVAHRAYHFARALRLRVNYSELVRGALLHDYYLYDWHVTDNSAHAVNHPVLAVQEADKDFDLSEKERNIISSHMWPLPPTRVPRCKEAWLVCLADKYCSLQETLFRR